MLLLLCALVFASDLDGDGIDDVTDNCDTIANPDQTDGNADGYGDACAHPTATVGANVFIARGGYIDAGATVGANTVIVGATVGQGAQVGADAVIYGSIADETPGTGPAIIGTGTLLARRGTVAAGAVVGDDALVFAAVPTQVRVGDRSVVGRGAELAPLVRVGDDTRLRASVGLSSVIGDRVAIGRSTLGQRVTVHDDVRIGTFVTIEDNAVIGAGARIRWRVDVGDSANIGEDVFLARNADVGDDAIVGDRARVPRDGIIPEGQALPADAVLTEGQPLDLAEVCTDAVDNDLDGSADCEDTDCFVNPNCMAETTCNDGVDDDLDGLIDCDDADCRALGLCPGEGDCADGLDNDADQYIDCLDPDCWGGADCQTETGLACFDAYDNDLDGNPSAYDSDCGTPPENCSLAWPTDNDLDGLPNWRDPDCVPTTPTETVCTDGLDNDNNGLVDCEDAGCATNPWCIEDCLDGIDNDGDGDRDCDDIDCIDSPCLVERRIAGGSMQAGAAFDQVLRSKFGVNDDGYPCQGVAAGAHWANSTMTMVAFVDLAVQLRVPTSAGGVVSSTCYGDRVITAMEAELTRSYAAAFEPITEIGAWDQADPSFYAIGRWSSGCAVPHAASRAAVMRSSPAAVFIPGTPNADPVLHEPMGSWDLGQPAYWVASSYGYTETGTAFRGECGEVLEITARTFSASWEIAPQTHTVSSP